MLEQLAQSVLDMLASQRAFFDCDRGNPNRTMLLHESKRAESQLRKVCQAILAGPEKPDLFTGA